MGRPSVYPAEFRREAIELVKTSGRSRDEVARSLGVSDTALANWVRGDELARVRAEDPDGLTESERDELKRLRKENLELHTDKEILWKAAAYVGDRVPVCSKHRDTYPVARLCRVVGINRAGFYKWASHVPLGCL